MRSAFAAVVVLLAAPASAQAGIAATSFSADGTFTVPAGVSAVDITAVGAHGAPGAMTPAGTQTPGGRGARVAGTLTVAAGTTLTVRVGHGGGAGLGGTGIRGGGAGGGSAEVLSDGQPRLVAAGGGGAGGGLPGAAGAGGDAGAAGGGRGGGAGTTTSGGAGGSPFGQAGSSEMGGAGGELGSGGGGGGGGLFGGGGGGGAVAAGGGGGGASFADPTVVAGAAFGLSPGGPASVTLVYSESVAPSPALAQPPDDPATFTGAAGSDTGDLPAVIIDLFRGAEATGAPLLSVTADVAAGAFSAPVPPLADGTWTARVRQSDAAGNTGAGAARTFVVETSRPVVTLTSPGAAVNTSRPHFAGAAGALTGDLAAVTVTITPPAGAPITLTATAAGGAWFADLEQDLADGTYTVVASQDDTYRNHGASAPHGFIIDTRPPEIDLGAVRSTYAFGETAVPAFTCTDAGSGVTACDGPVALDAAPGEHDFAVTATDRAGNTRTAHAHYTVLAAAHAASTPPPAVLPAAKAPAALKITAVKARHRGKRVTLTVRGTAAGSGAVKVSALGHAVRATLARGAWKTTLTLKTATKRVKLSVSYPGDASHLAGAATKTVKVR